jgi:curved DNA-binding protein CbpA
VQDLYELLEVAPTASAEVITAALTAQRRTWMQRQSAPTMERRQEAEQMLARLAEAERTLLDPTARAQYDAQHSATPPTHTNPAPAPAPNPAPQPAPTPTPTPAPAAAPATATSGLDWPKTAKILNIVIIVGIVIGSISLLAYRRDTSTYNAYDDSSYDDDTYDNGSDTTTYDSGSSGTYSTNTTPPTTAEPIGCQDTLNSANWPPTTQGPVVECPANPFGTPGRALYPTQSGWIAVLESIPLAEVGRVDSRAAELESASGDALFLYDSRMHAGLRDPYWVIFAGPFASSDDASAYCSSRPQLDPCYPRQL